MQLGQNERQNEGQNDGGRHVGGLAREAVGYHQTPQGLVEWQQLTQFMPIYL